MSVTAIYQRSAEAMQVPRPSSIVCNSIWARLAVWLLGFTNHDVRHTVTEDRISYTKIDSRDIDTLLDSILSERDFAMIQGQEIDRILVGRDLWVGIQNDAQHPVTIQHSVDGSAICGVDVQFVPQMDGFLVLSK